MPTEQNVQFKRKTKGSICIRYSYWQRSHYLSNEGNIVNDHLGFELVNWFEVPVTHALLCLFHGHQTINVYISTYVHQTIMIVRTKWIQMEECVRAMTSVNTFLPCLLSVSLGWSAELGSCLGGEAMDLCDRASCQISASSDHLAAWSPRETGDRGRYWHADTTRTQMQSWSCQITAHGYCLLYL